MKRLMSLATALVLTTPIVTAAAEDARWGGVYTCQFPTAGTIVIDTAPSDMAITVGGKRYPVQSGSYFLQGTDDAPLVDGDPIVIMFGPNLKYWEFYGERSESCDYRAEPVRT